MAGHPHRRVGFGEAGVVLVIFSAAFALALVVTAVTGQLSSTERWEYSEIAENILLGRGAVYDYLGAEYYFYGSSVYPIVLAAVLWASNQAVVAVLVLQAVIFAFTCVAIYLVSRCVLGKMGAGLAATLAVFHPGSLIYAGKLQSQTLDVFFIIFSFFLLVQVTLTSTRPIAVRSGFVAGLASLSRGTVLPFFLLWTAWFLWKERKRLSRAAVVVVALALGGLLAIAPVLLQGYLLYGVFLPLRTDTGVNLWYGNHPGASGTSYTLSPSPVPVIKGLPPALLDRLVGANEIEQNRILMATVLDFVRDDPASAFLLFLKKLYYFWWFSPHSGLLYPAKWVVIYKVFYCFILFFAVVGFVDTLRSTRPSVRSVASVFLLMASSVSVTQALFYVEGRHRWQIEPLLLVFTAAGFLYCLARLKEMLGGRSRRVAGEGVEDWSV